MVNGSSLDDLLKFLADPTPSKLPQIVSIPALYRILESEGNIEPYIPLLQWLAQKTTKVLQDLLVEAVSLDSNLSVAIDTEQRDWKSVSIHHLSQYDISA